MGIRRKAREIALQSLYQMEFEQNSGLEAFELFCRHFQINKKSLPYAKELVLGVAAKKEELNELIRGSADNWRLERMSVIDRNIIRLAVYEICFCDDVPAEVAINEAVEIAKRFGTEESGAFINGVLDAVNRAVGG